MQFSLSKAEACFCLRQSPPLGFISQRLLLMALKLPCVPATGFKSHLSAFTPGTRVMQASLAKARIKVCTVPLCPHVKPWVLNSSAIVSTESFRKSEYIIICIITAECICPILFHMFAVEMILHMARFEQHCLNCSVVHNQRRLNTKVAAHTDFVLVPSSGVHFDLSCNLTYNQISAFSSTLAVVCASSVLI